MAKREGPKWMSKPREEERKLSGVPMKGWIGEVRVSDIRAFVDNRRTDRQVAILRKKLQRVPTDAELFEFFKDDPDLEIERLAENIIQNGLRVPLVISYDKVLLDGNRRYFAHRWIVKNRPELKASFETVKAWVLSKEFSDPRNKLRIVTEYNFLEDLRIKWNDYVKAKLLWEEYNDARKEHTYDTLTELYGGPGFGKGKVVEFIKTYEIIMEYIRQSDDEDEAIAKASENFIWFQQLQRSNRDEIRNDEEFQKAVFKNIREDIIERTDQLKNLRDVRRFTDAWSEFKKGNVGRAHEIRQYHVKEEKDNPDPNEQIEEINMRLAGLLKDENSTARISPEHLAEFHQFAEKIPGRVQDLNLRVSYILERLDSLTSAELANLSSAGRSRLELALNRVIKQASAT
jgi:hypothetical protein